MFPPVIDNTMRSNINMCLRKFYYNNVENLHHSEGKSIHLHAGGTFARGLEVARKAFYVAGLTEKQALQAGQDAAVEFWGDAEYPKFVAKNKALPRIIEALAFYFNHWPMGTDFLQPHVTPEGEYCIEFKFALPIPVLHPDTGQPILYAGRTDLIANYHGKLVVEDDKTTGQLGQQWIDNWTLDSQNTGYCWAARTMGHPVTGAINRGISFLSEKIDKTSGEVLTNMSYGAAQAVVTRSQWEIDRWMKQLIRDVERAIACYKEGYFDFALDKGACNAYGGCTYTDLCTSKDPRPFMESEYKVVIWNPLD